jgi:diaminopimelate decarboxylase
MQFITLRPNVVLIDIRGKDHIIRKAEKLEDIIVSENTPEHLK